MGDEARLELGFHIASLTSSSAFRALVFLSFIPKSNKKWGNECYGKDALSGHRQSELNPPWSMLLKLF